MMAACREWFSLAELAACKLPGMPATEKSLDNFARTNWRGDPSRTRQAAGKTKPVRQYHVSLLPLAAQTRLLALHAAPANDDADLKEEARASRWRRFEGLSNSQKSACEDRLKALTEREELMRAGTPSRAAIDIVARRVGASRSAVYLWLASVASVDRADWLAALAPRSKASAVRLACCDEAWSFLTSDYLRPESPTFTSCYRRLQKAAKKERWIPIPSERSLRRRLDAEVPAAVQVLARSGRDKAKTLYPAQRRLRGHLHAMQAVNMDGHKIDVFVRVPWAEKPVRLYLVAIQDLSSGKILSWRLSDAETWETVRLVIGDMVEAYGIPDNIYLDNGRAFASKWISGGNRTRFRFKVKKEDPRGLLTTLGVTQHFTTPYAGQSKPIERAWRDLADTIARHPACAGAYTGNKPDAKPENYASRAIDLAVFRQHVATEIADHNAREGRRAANCAGRSFDTTFAASMADPATIVRWPTKAQKALWLLASEMIRTRKGSGEIHYQGNRYWSAALNQHAGRKVTIRFDPDRLHAPVRVYDLDNALICEADCIADTGFNDIDAARHHARSRRDFIKAVAAQKTAQASLTAQQLADILSRGETPRSEPEPIRPAVKRLARGNLALKPVANDQIDNQQFDDGFSKAMAQLTGGASIHQFPHGNEPECSAYGSKKRKPGVIRL